jgi:hypothetical protein
VVAGRVGALRRDGWLAVLATATSLVTAGCAAQPSAADVPSSTATATATATAATSPPSSTPAGDQGTAGYASAFLGAGGASGSDDAFVHVSVWAPPDAEPFANGEFFVLGYDCLTEETVPAAVDGLGTASAGGELPLTCGSHTHEGEITGTAVLDLTWTAQGPVEQHTVESTDGSCAEDLSVRHAVVTGQVHLVLPALGYDGVATPLGDDDDSISQGVPACG